MNNTHTITPQGYTLGDLMGMARRHALRMDRARKVRFRVDAPLPILMQIAGPPSSPNP